jgi:alkylhydroperoxidase/carboxymuconolactone decarboxylase family protein YurZ
MVNGSRAVSSTSQRSRVAAAAANHGSTEEARGHASYAVAPQGGAPPAQSSNATRHEPVRAKIV